MSSSETPQDAAAEKAIQEEEAKEGMVREAAATESFERRLLRKCVEANEEAKTEEQEQCDDSIDELSRDIESALIDPTDEGDGLSSVLDRYAHPLLDDEERRFGPAAADDDDNDEAHRENRHSRRQTRYLHGSDVARYEDRVRSKVEAEAAARAAATATTELNNEGGDGMLDGGDRSGSANGEETPAEVAAAAQRGASREEGRAPFLNVRRFRGRSFRRRRLQNVVAEEARTEGREGPTVTLDASVRAPQTPLDPQSGGGIKDALAGGGDVDKLVSAVLVDNEDVVEALPFDEKRWSRRRILFYFGVVLAALAVVVGLSVGLTNGNDDDEIDASGNTPTPATSHSPSSSPSFDPRPTLQSIKEDGVLRCGIPENPWFARINEATGEEEGFSVDICRAIAAAVLGNESYDILTTVVTRTNRWSYLADRTVDVLISGDTHTMERDLFEPTTKRGYSFTVPYFYDGVQAAGIPEYVDCVEGGDRFSGNCSELKICIEAGTTHVDAISEQVPGYFIQQVNSSNDFVQALTSGTCNVVAGELPAVAEEHLHHFGYAGAYKLGNTMYSKEPLAMVTREEEPQWSDFVDVILQGLMKAEADNITQESSGAFPDVMLFGGQYRNALNDAIAAVGNFGEVYERNFPRTDLNQMNTGTSGLIYSIPFGSLDAKRPNPGTDSTLSAIRERGKLRCGMPGRRNEIDLYALDATYCRALAAVIFQGSKRNIELVRVNLSEGRFAKLASGEIDVLSGCSLRNTGNSVEPNVNFTGEGFSFSQPYFYHSYTNDSSVDAYRALATRQDDAQWSDFVFWVVSATFYAAEEDLRRNFYNILPLVDLFGPNFNWMFKDLIRFVGNYDVIYEEIENRTSVFDRNNTRNEINADPFGGQYYSLYFQGASGYL